MYTIENNMPSAGNIRWTGLKMVYAGVTYTLTDGYTNYHYVYWKVATPTVLIVSDTYPSTLTRDDCLVFLNKSGTAVTVPNSTVIDGDLIVPGSIVANAIAANCITGDKLVTDAITTREIAADAITAGNIAANAVTSGTIAANAIGAAAISAGVITGDKLVAGTITSTQIAANTVTSNNILANTIVAADIAALTITSAQISAGTITATQIAANTITSNNILAGTIVSADIAANTITSANILAGTIVAADIAAGAITGDMITGGTITGVTLKTSAIDHVLVQGSNVKVYNGAILGMTIGITKNASDNLPFIDFFPDVSGVGPSKSISIDANAKLTADLDIINVNLLVSGIITASSGIILTQTADNIAASTYIYDSGDGRLRRKTLANVREELSAIPGTVAYFAMSVAPLGWLKCNGALLTKTSYPDLSTAIGIIYGGDSTQFNLPDLRGKFIRSWDDGAGNDTRTPSRVFGSNEAGGNESHSHLENRAVGTDYITSAFVQSADAGLQVGYRNDSTYTQNSGYAETTVKNLALLACIKY